MVAAPLRAGTSSTRAKTDEQKSPAIRVTSEQPGISATIEGERETVTALFADIKGSSELRSSTPRTRHHRSGAQADD
jgi:class 3 adenylate cyclase